MGRGGEGRASGDFVNDELDVISMLCPVCFLSSVTRFRKKATDSWLTSLRRSHVPPRPSSRGAMSKHPFGLPLSRPHCRVLLRATKQFTGETESCLAYVV